MGKQKFQNGDSVIPTKYAPAYAKNIHEQGHSMTIIGREGEKYLVETSNHGVLRLMSNMLVNPQITDSKVSDSDAADKVKQAADKIERFVKSQDNSTAEDIKTPLEAFIQQAKERANEISQSIAEPLAKIKDINITISVATAIKRVPDLGVISLMNFMIHKSPELGHKDLADLYKDAEECMINLKEANLIE